MAEAFSIDCSTAINSAIGATDRDFIVEDHPDEVLVPVERLSGKPARKKLGPQSLRLEEAGAMAVGSYLVINGIRLQNNSVIVEHSNNALSVLVNNPSITVGIAVLILNFLVGEVRDSHKRNAEKALEF